MWNTTLEEILEVINKSKQEFPKTAIVIQDECMWWLVNELRCEDAVILGRTKLKLPFETLQGIPVFDASESYITSTCMKLLFKSNIMQTENENEYRASTTLNPGKFDEILKITRNPLIKRIELLRVTREKMLIHANRLAGKTTPPPVSMINCSEKTAKHFKKLLK